MSYKSKFKYNEAYSNTDIAEALSIITGTGIAPSTPSAILSKYVTSGVTYADEQLNVSISGTTVTVGCGAAVWSDGSYIIVYEPETFTVSLTETYYVYLKYNTVGDIEVACETALPTANYMLLATVKNGVVTDNRTYARSNVANYGKSSLQELTRISSDYNQATYALPKYNFSMIIFIYPNDPSWKNRAAIYDADSDSFLKECNMLRDTGSSSDNYTVSKVVRSGNNINVTFNNMEKEKVDKTYVYCV